MKNILVPVDFSDVTDAVLRLALEVGKPFQAKIHLLHVAAPDPDFVGYEPGPPSVRVQLAEKFRDEHRKIQALKEASGLPEDGIHAHLIQGPFIQKILEEADRLQADLLVIGSHGHGALYNLLMGSVAEGILRDSRCPVLVVPSRYAS